MYVFRRLCRIIGAPLAVLLALSSYPATGARAALVGTEQAVSGAPAPVGNAQAQREQVASFLRREDVRRQIEAMGVDPKEADARVASLSDAEVAKLAARIDQIPAGAGVAAVFIILGIIFAVLLALDLLGVTHIFKVFR
jgi:hypothetical protein